MGPTWGRQDPGGLHVGPMNPVIRGLLILYDGFYSVFCTAVLCRGDPLRCTEENTPYKSCDDKLTRRHCPDKCNLCDYSLLKEGGDENKEDSGDKEEWIACRQDPIKVELSIHRRRVTHICVSKIGLHWIILWLVESLAPRHYLNQCWLYR